MTVAQTIKHIVPAAARTLIKKNSPEFVERLAIGLDSIPLFLNGRAWQRLLQPNPNQRQHPLASKMWSGFGERAASELERSKLSTQRDRKVLVATTWALAKWYAYNGNTDKALENLVLMTTAMPRICRNVYTQLMIVECLLKLDRPDEAQ